MVSFYESVQLSAAISPANLDITSSISIQGVARTIAAGAMSYYPGTETAFADLPTPYYWWEMGALVGSMLDYSHFTQDPSYDAVIRTALSSQVVAPDYNLMVPSHFGDEGNDDQAFWGFAIMAAAERNFPQASDPTLPSWLTVGENTWNSLVSRWNTSACGGGLLWQIFASNPNGLNYRNTVSNGGLFQLSARLYRATNDQKYLDWAEKVWDWSTGVGFIDTNYYVYDGADSAQNCTDINPLSFSYSTGIYLYGAAVLANVSTDTKWMERTTGLLEASRTFFSPFDNATNIMYEHACEQVELCNTDMKSFKGYLSRFMYQSTQMVPSLLPTVQELLHPSAMAAAAACSGGADGTTCGQKWYVGGFDGSVGLGQEMCALETVQGLLISSAAPPLKAGEIQDVRVGQTINAPVLTTVNTPVETAIDNPGETTIIVLKTTVVTPSDLATTADSAATDATTTAVQTSVADTPATNDLSSPTDTKRSTSAGSVVGVDGAWVGLSMVTALLVWGLM